MSLITPTVGRKVWFFENSQQAEPIDATVIKVYDNPDGSRNAHSAVNLSILDPDTGAPGFRSTIAWHAAEQQYDGRHFRWMPNQAAQAQKVVESEAAAAPAPAEVDPAQLQLDVGTDTATVATTDTPAADAEPQGDQAPVAEDTAASAPAPVEAPAPPPAPELTPEELAVQQVTNAALAAVHARIEHLQVQSVRLEGDSTVVEVVALVDGKETHYEAAFSPAPWPAEANDVMTAAVRQELVDSLLTRRSIDDGTPTSYLRGEPDVPSASPNAGAAPATQQENADSANA